MQSVATIKSVRKDKVYLSHLLRRTYRENGKVKHHTLGNISHLPAHIIAPCSTLATCRALADETKFTTVGEALNLGDVDEDKLYEALDWLVAHL
jgi:hypothetical protein